MSIKSKSSVVSSKSNKLNTATLSNGLRIVFEHKDSEVIHCGYVICAGTRHEEPADSGMAHFIEHMSFNGTERRSGHYLSTALDRLGGDLNAYTGKQETVYHATVLREDFSRAVDVLTDLVFHSTFPQQEIEKEVEVIVDEIESYLDRPSDLIFDDFEAMLFEGSPLGRDILGRAERLHEYTTVDARRFADRYYRPANAVFFVTGNLSWKRVLDRLAHWHAATVLDDSPAPAASVGTPRPEGRLQGKYCVVEKGTHQAHVILGSPTPGHSDDPRKCRVLSLLNNILGGPSSNSRLYTTLREKAALVYNIDSFDTIYPDAGWWCIYFGCDTDDVDRCLRLVHKVLHEFVSKPLSPIQLARAKKQMIGQATIADENAESYALAVGKVYARYGVCRSTADIVEEINSVTAEELQQLAAEIFAPERISTLIYK